ncbi:MAG: S8 family peptidase [Synergistaceae bacterium]|jgi:hypothetical protein|nr:S8 family peptidase [Synergistaceae bacterium]
MPERPLLIFPTPVSVDRAKLGGGGGKPHVPTAARQWERLSPKFEQLRNTFIQVQPNVDGIEPESVLVIETIGAIEKFVNAVKKIEGFEWLGEVDEEELAPDDDFFDESQRDKLLSGRLYWVWSNQQALKQMLSLWEHYKDNSQLAFERGLTKFRDVFLQLRDIRRWDTRDRLEETGVLDAWREDLQDEQLANTFIHCEIELWFRDDQQKRTHAQWNVASRIEQIGGQIVSQTTIPEISYHALLATLPRNEIQNVLNDNREAAFLNCDSVRFFRPCGQMVFGKEPAAGEIEDVGVNVNLPLPIGQPTIALFDGQPLENHSLLSGRLIVDDPDNYGSDYAANARKHGTAIASLIIQGDLNDGQSPLARPLYVRPIMRPQQTVNGGWAEHVPENVLFTDLLHRSVRRLFELEDGQTPVASSVRIINLSIGDPARQFVNAMSPAAKLLDWLSEKYNVLFIVSAGNHPVAIRINQTAQTFNSMSPDEREAEVVKALYANRRNCRLLAPAETINGLTAGALHSDSSTLTNTPNRVDLLAHTFLPSPISAFGCGYRRSIKPDLIFSGGRQLYQEPISRNAPVKLLPSYVIIAPGNKTAVPGSSGQANSTSFSRGTSNAAALISRSAGICYDSLLQLLADQPREVGLGNSDVPLLKAMLVHSCSWGEAKYRMGQIFSDTDTDIKKIADRWLGYGTPDIQRVLECARQRATVLGFGQLTDGQAHLFSLPLPPSLGAQRIRRRLTVTLAWFSRIVPYTQKYRESSLWFEVLNNRLASDRAENDWQTVKRGTVQHEIFEGERAEPISDGDVIQIKVNCRNDAKRITNPVQYGLVVSLEVARGQGTDIAIYDEIRDRIMTPIQERAIT